MDNNLEKFVLKLTHTGVHADGHPNTNSVVIPDLDVGYEYQHRKTPVYVPVGGSISVPYTSRAMYSVTNGAVKKFVDQGIITAVTEIVNASGVARPLANSGNLICWHPYADVDASQGYLKEFSDVVALANSLVGPVTIQILTNPDDQDVMIPTKLDANGDATSWVFTNPTTLVGRCVSADTESASNGPDEWARPDRLDVTTDFGCTIRGLVGLKDIYFYSYSGERTIIVDNSYSWSSFFCLDNTELRRDYEDYEASLYIDCDATVVLKNSASIRWYAMEVDGYATVTTDGTNCWIGVAAVFGDGIVDFFVNPGSAFNSSQDVDCTFNRMWIQNVEMHDSNIYDSYYYNGNIEDTYFLRGTLDSTTLYDNCSLGYAVNNTNNWAGSDPTNVKDALDRIVAKLVSINAGWAP